MSNIISLFSNNTQITFQRQEDGYINATSLCKSVGREFHTWNRSKSTIAFIKELSYDTQICGTDLIQIQQGGEPHLQGTWVHPQVAINLAQWLSPKFAVQVSKWVQEWITKKEMPQTLKNQLPQIDSKFLLQIAQQMEEKEKLIELQSEKIIVLEIETMEQQNKIEEKDEENQKLKATIKDFFKGAELFTRRQVCHFLARQGLEIKEQQITDYLNKKKWLCKGEHNSNKATAESCRICWFVNDISVYEFNGRKKTSEYGKFTVEGLVGIYDTFKKPAELNK
jgi:hypothetical protein